MGAEEALSGQLNKWSDIKVLLASNQSNFTVATQLEVVVTTRSPEPIELRRYAVDSKSERPVYALNAIE